MQGNAFSESYSGLGDRRLSQGQEGRSPRTKIRTVQDRPNKPGLPVAFSGLTGL
jgi:hypothetical protein